MGVTRLPNGLSFVKPNLYGSQTDNLYFTQGDQTPDVSQGSFFFTGASALTITNFDGGQQGQLITVVSNSGGATTIQNSAGGINITNLVYSVSATFVQISANTGNAVMLNNEAISFYHDGTDWHATSTRVVDANS